MIPSHLCQKDNHQRQTPLPGKKITSAGEEAKMTLIHCWGTVASSATMEISVLISQNQNKTKNTFLGSSHL